MSVDTGYLAAKLDGCPSTDFALRVAAKAFGITITELTLPARYCHDRKIDRYRSVSMAAIRIACRPTYRAIGEVFGGRNHSSIVQACQRCQRDVLMHDAVESLVYVIRKQWATDHGLPAPQSPNQLTLTEV